MTIESYLKSIPNIQGKKDMAYQGKYTRNFQENKNGNRFYSFQKNNEKTLDRILKEIQIQKAQKLIPVGKNSIGNVWTF